MRNTHPAQAKVNAIRVEMDTYQLYARVTHSVYMAEMSRKQSRLDRAVTIRDQEMGFRQD